MMFLLALFGSYKVYKITFKKMNSLADFMCLRNLNGWNEWLCRYQKIRNSFIHTDNMNIKKKTKNDSLKKYYSNVASLVCISVETFAMLLRRSECVCEANKQRHISYQRHIVHWIVIVSLSINRIYLNSTWWSEDCCTSIRKRNMFWI